MDAQKELDTRGLNCPLPILKAKKALADMASGEVLKVLATDPGYAAKLNALTPHAKTILEVGCAVLVVVVGFFLQHRAKQKHKAHDPVDLAADKGKE